MSMTTSNPAPRLAAERPSLAGALTLRAILLGVALTLGIAVAAPLNDYVYKNSPLIGNHLPMIVVALVALLAAVVNPILGKRRLTVAEMAVALAMMLVACGLPTSGLFRVFQTTLGEMVALSNVNIWMREYINALPNWLLPSKDATSQVIQDFVLGLGPRGGHTMAGTWAAWAEPYVTWSCFLLPYYGCVLLLCALFRKQWVERERLAFPQVTILTSLMDPPVGTERLGRLWKNKVLWVGALIPIVIHGINGLHQIYPNGPLIPLNYNVAPAFSEFPWSNINWFIKTGSIFFSVIGVTYFVPTDIAFSIWFFFLAQEFGVMFVKATGTDVPADARSFQLIGIDAVYVVGLIWLARGHLAHVWRNLLKPREPDEFLPYGVIVGGMALCTAVATGFLVTAGVPWWLALSIFFMLLLWSMIIARVVMESGLLFIQIGSGVEPFRVLSFFITPATEIAARLAQVKAWTVSVLSYSFGMTDMRENLMGFAGNATKLASEVNGKSRVKFFLMLALAVVMCFFAAGATHHIIDYRYGNRLLLGPWPTQSFPTGVLHLAQDMVDPGANATSTNRPLHFGYGAAAMGLVMLGRGLFTGFPFHPIGLVVGNSYATSRLWQSVLIAWALKVLILRWGGSRGYTEAKPFFLGLLVGESLMAVSWAVMGLFITWPGGVPYSILPG